MTPLAELLQTYSIRRVELAGVAGVSLETLSCLTRGQYSTLRLGLVVRVAHALGVAPADLVPGFDRQPPKPGLVQSARGRMAAARRMTPAPVHPLRAAQAPIDKRPRHQKTGRPVSPPGPLPTLRDGDA